MAVVGEARINILPTFKGFKEQIEAQIGSIDGNAAGQKTGQGVADGIAAKTGVIAGAFAALTEKALSAVSNHLGSAIARFDTLNNYPKVMESLGYSSSEVNASLSTMDTRLQGLPTALNTMVSTVQGLVVTTNDLTKATDLGIAVNDMLIAAGAGAQASAGALEQFRQILSKGKPEMQDWKSLMSAMPGQMNQLAKAMLGAEATTDDLYAALGGGSKKAGEATISMEELIDAVIRLDNEGGEGITSFKEQAFSAAGGIQTSMDNLGTAITRGVANIFSAIGQDNITTVFNDLKSGINTAFTVAKNVITAAMPAIKGVYDIFKQIGPTILGGAGIYLALSKTVPMVTKFGSALSLLPTQLGLFKLGFKEGTGIVDKFAKANAAAATSINPMGLAIAGVTAAITIGVSAYTAWKEKTETATKATVGLQEAIKNSGALDNYNGVLTNIGTSAGKTRISIDDLNKSIAEHVDAMNQRTEKAKGEIAQLSTVQKIITDSIGVTDLDTEAQGRLKWALEQLSDQFGVTISEADVINGFYEDQEGNVHDLKDSIYDLIEAKKQEILFDMNSANYEEALKNQQAAMDAYKAKFDELSSSQQAFINTQIGYGYSIEEANAKWEKYTRESLQPFVEALDNANDEVSTMETRLGSTIGSVEDIADAYRDWGDSMNELTGMRFEALLSDNGGLPALERCLESLGADMSSVDWDEGKLQSIVRSWDGSASSLVGTLTELGVSMDDTAKAAASTTNALSDALTGFGSAVSEAFSRVGLDVDLFASHLADAEITVEQLNAVGSDNMAKLADSFNGDIDLMIWAIQHFNNTPVEDKDGNINIDQAELIDAQGNVYVWNGTDLIDKETEAVADVHELVDAQGNFYTWNNSTLKRIEGSAHVSSNISSVLDELNRFNNSSLKNIMGTISATVKPNAAGGIRTHADGGVMRSMLSEPVIATRAVPLDIVGEAGAEAIVPLTNERYSRPFVDMIAEGVTEQSNMKEAVVMLISWLESNLGGLISKATPSELSVDGRAFASLTRRYA